MATNNTEKQLYKLLYKEGDIEIRFYPAATIATIQSDAKTYKELSGPGFRKLAGYIFGNNQGAQKIAMTTPVHMDINDLASSMSFVMPSVYKAEALPAPNDPSVKISTTSEEYVAAIQFGGFANDSNIKTNAEKLQQFLAEKGIHTTGRYRFLGYNPPYQLVGRRNEVIIPVKWEENLK